MYLTDEPPTAYSAGGGIKIIHEDHGNFTLKTNKAES